MESDTRRKLVEPLVQPELSLPLIEYEWDSTWAKTFRLAIFCWSASSSIKIPSSYWGDAGGSLLGLTHPLNEPRILEGGSRARHEEGGVVRINLTTVRPVEESLEEQPEKSSSSMVWCVVTGRTDSDSSSRVNSAKTCPFCLRHPYDLSTVNT